MQQTTSSSSSSSSSDILAKDTFTISDFNDKIKETILLAKEILQNSNAKKNEKIQNLIKIQCCNTLKILTKLNQNDLNPNSRDCNFTRAKFDDQQKISKLLEIDDALIDKTIHYFECAQNLKEKRKSSQPNLIQVQMNVDSKQNNSKIFIKDFNKNQSGIKRKYPSDNNSNNVDSSPLSQSKRNFLFIAASNVKRPQIVYKIKTDNSYSTPFIPKLTRKPNSLVSLEDSLKPISQNELPANLIPGYNYPKYFYQHPYQYEIENFKIPSEFFHHQISDESKQPPPSSESLKEKRYKFINKRDDLHELIEDLKRFQEIAIDLEHHSFRSYQGLTCLLQISTDLTDYIIDVFPLWNDIQILNEIFTLPSILKVFHSSTYDIIWLQRDLGIYVVNMFDTWVAAKTLDYQHLSLSSLVDHYCHYQLDKRFQLADWRIRPIPEEMLQYARCDTHFLLYIYRKLKQQLLDAGNETGNLLRVVMERSQQMCLKRYEKKLPEINDHIHLIWKNNLRFNPRQMAALKSLYVWRDLIARQEDESTGYVLPNNLLLKICEILPREQQGILACCNPIPPLVRQYINEIHRIIFDARSKVLIDQNSTETIQSSMKNDITIDLTNDLLIDRPLNFNKFLTIDHHHNDHHNNDDDHLANDQNEHFIIDQPLLQWSNELKKFIPNSRKNNDNNNDKSSGIEIQSIRNDIDHHSLINMFDNQNISSSSSLCRKSTNKMIIDDDEKEAENFSKKTKTNRVQMDKLFDGYITFYQRYLYKIKQKDELRQQQQSSS